MYTEKDLAALVETLQKEFSAEIAKSEAEVGQVLAKSEEDSEHKDEKHKEEKEAPKASSEEKAPEKAPAGHEDKADEAAGEEPEAGHAKEHDPAHEESQEAEEHKEEHNDAKEDHCDYDDEDLAEMHKMYGSMSKAECKAHHDACRKALDAHGMQKCGEMSMEKSEVIEVKTEEVKPSEEVTLLKSEVESEKAKFEELKKNFDLVCETLTKLVTKNIPQGKAITSLDTIAKSEVSAEAKNLTKSEVTAILQKKDYSKFSKTERDAINSFYLGSGNINSINHLLT